MIADRRRRIFCNGWRWAILTAGSLVTFLAHAGQGAAPGFSPERYGTLLIGTFINDRMISSEQRLKHGDRIRLHKYEFEFVIPELFGTGMTIVSVDNDDDDSK